MPTPVYFAILQEVVNRRVTDNFDVFEFTVVPKVGQLIIPGKHVDFPEEMHSDVRYRVRIVFQNETGVRLIQTLKMLDDLAGHGGICVALTQMFSQILTGRRVF